MVAQVLEPQQALYPRRTAARVLGTSVATVIRLERMGRLSPIKLSGSPTGSTYYSAEEVRALATAKLQGQSNE